MENNLIMAAALALTASAFIPLPLAGPTGGQVSDQPKWHPVRTGAS